MVSRFDGAGTAPFLFLFLPFRGNDGQKRQGYAWRMAEKSPVEKILAAVRAIPRGQVAGYGEVARRAGLPGRARLAAKVLSENDDPKLPWHRVLRSDGRIAFPEGSKMFREQSQRLRAEGVVVVQGKVRGQKAAASIDEQIWGHM